MSVYTTGAAAYRDTTKWLVAFVPVATLVTAGVVVGPALIDSASGADGFADFVASNRGLLVGVVLVIGGIWLVIGSGSDVLAAQPKDLKSAIETNPDGEEDALAVAFGEGLGTPYYFDSSSFRRDLRNLTSPEADLDSPAAKRAVATVPLVREWALHRELGIKFTDFRRRFVLGVVGAVIGLLLAVATADDAAPDVAPVAVEVVGPDAGDLVRSNLGCERSEATIWKVGGSWSKPILEADGAGCNALQWALSTERVAVRPAE